MTKKAEILKEKLDKFIDYYIAAKGIKPDVIRIPEKDRTIFKKEVSTFNTYKEIKVVFE